MSDIPVLSLCRLQESKAVISTQHLRTETRRKLADGDLSVLAYPNEYGGFVFVGDPNDNVPSEPDLAEIFAVAIRAKIVWLKIDRDALLVDGLPVYEDAEEEDA